MLSNWAIKQLQRITLDYMKLECSEGTCYGIIAVSSNKHPCLAVKCIHVFGYHRFIEYALHWFFSMLY